MMTNTGQLTVLNQGRFLYETQRGGQKREMTTREGDIINFYK